MAASVGTSRARTRIGSITVLTAIFLGMLAIPLAAPAMAALTGPTYPPPGGVTVTSTPGTEAAAGKAGGLTWSYTGLDFARFSDLYWGPQSPPQASFDGDLTHAGETMTFDGSQSNLSAGVGVWTGSAAIRIASGGGYTTSTLPTRFTLNVTDAGGTPIALLDAASNGIPAVGSVAAQISGDYKAHFIYEALYSSTWRPMVDLYNSLNTDPTKKTMMSFGAGYFYNQFPTASDETLQTNEDTPLPFTLPASDPDGNALTYTILSGPDSGTLDGTAPDLTYTPGENFNGPDSFTYQVNDGLADSNVATISIDVIPVNDAPVAFDDSRATSEDTPITFTLTGDDPVEHDALTYSIVDGPQFGQLDDSALPDVTYTPDPNYNGPDSFTFKVNDGTDDSNVATIALTIDGVNDAPVAVDDAASTRQYTPVAIDVLSNDSDVEHDTLSVASVAQPADGTVTINPDGTLEFNPNPNFKGSSTFTYVVDDGNGGTATGTVTVTEIGCGEDGIQALDGSPLEGTASKTIDRTVEPVVGQVDPGLAETVHDTNCGTVVPAEDTIDGQ